MSIDKAWRAKETMAISQETIIDHIVNLQERVAKLEKQASLHYCECGQMFDTLNHFKYEGKSVCSLCFLRLTTQAKGNQDAN